MIEHFSKGPDPGKAADRKVQDRKVSKAQLLRFIEAKFELADRDQDGQLNLMELEVLLRLITHPD